LGALGRLRFFIDECLSPQIAMRLNEGGQHEAVHPLHSGRRGEDDSVVVARCIAEDRIIVTENARDFRKLVAREAIHPGLIVMPCVDRETSWRLLQAAISHLEVIHPHRPEDAIANHALEVDINGICILWAPLP
jgi:predicted nuclease of predicted toxin-antitoxin system